MQRISRNSAAACPTLFTPLQVQPRELLRFGVVSWVGWMRDWPISLQSMIREHSTAVVVAGANLEYTDSALFHDCETLNFETTASVHKDGVLIEGHTRFLADQRHFADVKIYFRPVLVGDENSAAAKPANLPAHLIPLFQPDEIRPEPYPRAVRLLLPVIQEQGQLLSTGERPFKLFRHAMDFADQWAFIETAAFVGAAREELVIANGGQDERLLLGISQPVSEYFVDLRKPFFLMDEGVVQTRVYKWGSRLAFVHELTSQSMGQTHCHAVVIEIFEGA